MSTATRWMQLAALAAAVAVPGQVVADVRGSGGAALGQATGTVTGVVLQSGSERPLAGAQVVVVGTGIGAVTNNQGDTCCRTCRQVNSAYASS